MKWRRMALAQQQQLFERLGDRHYDIISVNDSYQVLEKKVGFSLFGHPSTTEGIGYSSIQLETIMQLCEKIRVQIKKIGQNDATYIYFAVIYVSYVDLSFKHNKVEAVFRIGKNHHLSSNCSIFIDGNRRVYKSWDHFKSTNKLGECWICAPKNGIYEGDEHETVSVEFEKSHACSFGRQAFSIARNTVVVGCLGLLAAATMVPLAPAVAVASASLTAFEVFSYLMDLYDHDQSFADKASIFAFLTAATAPFAFLTSFSVFSPFGTAGRFPYLSQFYHAYSSAPLATISSTTAVNQALANLSSPENLSTIVRHMSVRPVYIFTELLPETEKLQLDPLTREKIRSILLFYFHIWVNENIDLGDLGEKITELLNSALNATRRRSEVNVEDLFSSSVRALTLTECRSVEEIVHCLARNGIRENMFLEYI